MITERLAWIDPLVAAAALGQTESCWVLLYSGQQSSFTGRYSYLALYPQEIVQGERFLLLEEKLSCNRSVLENAWFGYIGYELLHEVEPKLPREHRQTLSLPGLWFTRFGMVLRFDHNNKTLECYRESHIPAPAWPTAAVETSLVPPIVATLTSAMSKARYYTIVQDTIDAIRNGAFYQANITRKLTGTFAEPSDTFSVFCRLASASPAAYSAYMRIGESAILSSSPERFLRIDANGHMESRPIKGTAPRFSDPAEDANARSTLVQSIKDRAENLMIVDLMRNDLARSAKHGSVVVSDLFDVASYATVHHMASTISAQKTESISTLSAVVQCFPPGSMTGAPKYRAMQWCAAQEQVKRGVYSGALGWFGGDGSCDLSVVIRTLIVQGNRFEFQVGGGIVADSIPEQEWQETLTKARGILAALGVEEKILESI